MVYKRLIGGRLNSKREEATKGFKVAKVFKGSRYISGF